MFAFSNFGGGASAPNPNNGNSNSNSNNVNSGAGGGILGSSAPQPPVFGNQHSHSGNRSNSTVPPIFGGVLSGPQGFATPLAAPPVFGGSNPNNTNRGGGGSGLFPELNSQGILSQGALGAARPGSSSTSSSGTAVAPSPPGYATALPSNSTPVFGGASTFGAAAAPTTTGQQSLPPPPLGVSGPVRGGESSGPVFGQTPAAPFGRPAGPPLPVGYSQPPPFGAPPPPQQQQPQQHRKFNMHVPSTASTGGAPAAAFGTSGVSSVLGDVARGRSSAPQQQQQQSSVGFSAPHGGGAGSGLDASSLGSKGAAAAQPPPPFTPARQTPPPPPPPSPPSTGVLSTQESMRPPVSQGVSAPSNPFSSSSSSFSTPFGWSAATTTTTTAPAPPQQQANAPPPFTAAAAPPPTPAAVFGGAPSSSSAPPLPPPPFKPALTAELSSGSGGVKSFAALSTSAAPASTSVFGAPAPAPPAFGFSTAPSAPTTVTTSTPAFGTGSSVFGATNTTASTASPPPPSSGTPSVFAVQNTPVAPKASAFVPDPHASATATAAPAAKVFASLSEAAPPAVVKSAFGAAFAAGPAPPPPPSSAFGASAPPPPRASSSSFTAGGAGRGDRGEAAAFGSRDQGRRRGRSPTVQTNSQGTAAAAAAAPPPFSVPAPRHAQQHQQAPTKVSRVEKLSIPVLPQNEKQWSLAARVCKSFLLQLASPAAMGMGAAAGSRESGAAEALEQAFFGAAVREGISANFALTAGELLAVWQTHVRPMMDGGRNNNNNSGGALPFPGDEWVAVFALGTYVNVIVSTLTGPRASALPSAQSDLAAYRAGLLDHPAEAFTDACHYANELSELLQRLVQRGGEVDAPPYSVIPVVLRRVRTVFDEANARGVATVQSNLSAVTLKLFAVLNRRVKPKGGGGGGAAADESGRWLLTYETKDKESLLHSFAYLVCEMIAVDAPMNEDVEHFIDAFHVCLPSALAERCLLYYRRACALLRQPLRMQQVREAVELLAKGIAVYPPDAPPQNRRVLEVKLLTAELALGRLPPDEDRLALDVPQLMDVVNALRTSRLDLLDAALQMHGPFFVQSGVHNILMVARQRISLLMVVKYYVTHGCEQKMRVMDMVRYHRLPYSCAEAGMVWLLPLLVEMCMNGVLDHEHLVLSAKKPFDEYPREVLLSAAGLPVV